MAKSWTAIPIGDIDDESPWDQGLLEDLRDNETVLLLEPFPFPWPHTDPSESAGQRTTSGAQVIWPNHSQNIYIPPGVAELHIFLNGQWTSGTGTATAGFQITTAEPSIGGPYLAGTEATVTDAEGLKNMELIWSAAAELELNWGRQVVFDWKLGITSGSGTVRFSEDTDPHSYFRQAA